LASRLSCAGGLEGDVCVALDAVTSVGEVLLLTCREPYTTYQFNLSDGSEQVRGFW
jgi:hypothetical protein